MAAKNKKRQQQQQSSNGAEEHTTTNAGNGNGSMGDNDVNQNDPLIDENLTDSPLRIFGEAKEKINILYRKLDVCLAKANKFYSDPNSDPSIVRQTDKDLMRSLCESIEDIRGVLSRNHMKVAFFGHTSNGKSTVINAILHDNVLPRGYGVTTKCFLEIQGTRQNEAFVEVQKEGQKEERKPITFLNQMANALSTESVESSSLLKIHWPISKCNLLKHDVVFVDSPGISVDEDLDAWIDKYCHDADVFVLVSSAESTLNIAEKNFFHKVSKKLSKPIIFILNNRFDIIDQNEPESLLGVKIQHIKRAVQFLSKELEISTEMEAEQRTFFVSAKETLNARCPVPNSQPQYLASQRLEGYQDREIEFKNFERSFEESLSKSAVKTKFKKHCDRGEQIIQDLSNVLNITKNLVFQVSEKNYADLELYNERYDNIQKQFYAREGSLQNYLSEVKKRIQIVSDAEFDNEIRRLSRVVDDFGMEFSINPNKLQLYKEHLYKHVEECLSENLRARIYTVINKHINPFNKTICDLSMLLSEDRRQSVKNVALAQTYDQDDLFDLKIYKQFYSEFQEDLEFRFSLGLVTLLRKFQNRFSPDKANDLNNSLDQSLKTNSDVVSIMERFVMNPPQSPTTVGSLAIGGVLVRTVGWKVIIVTTAVYGALYAFEYLTWTNSAKERAFKAQYVRYAKKGLQDCVPIISQHIANSAEQKMSVTYGKLKGEIEAENAEVQGKISLLKGSLNKLRECDEFTQKLVGDNNVLMTELIAFATSFLN